MIMMNLNYPEFRSQLLVVLQQYEEGKRVPQRTLEMVYSLLNRVNRTNGDLPLWVGLVTHVVNGWEVGERADIEAVSIIAALGRKYADAEIGDQLE
jgi:hypothetical protein